MPPRRPLHNRHGTQVNRTPPPSFSRRREPIPGRCHRSCGNGESRAHSHTLCGLRKGIVIAMRIAAGLPCHVVPRPQRGTWGGVGLDHAERRRYSHTLCGLRKGIVIAMRIAAGLPCHVVPRPQRGTWGGVGLDHASRRRYSHTLVWPSQGHSDSREGRPLNNRHSRGGGNPGPA